MKVPTPEAPGYNGSTTPKVLEAAGHTPVILDDLISVPVPFVKDHIVCCGDIADRHLLAQVFAEHLRQRVHHPHGLRG